MLFKGDRVTDREAGTMGLILKAVPNERFDEEVEDMAAHMTTISVNQLAMQKWSLIRSSRQAVWWRGTDWQPFLAVSLGIHPKA